MRRDPSSPAAARTARRGAPLLGKALPGLSLACLSLLLIVLALAGTMPAATLARFVDLPPQVLAVEGLARRGRVRLDGGYQVDWALRGFRVLGVDVDVAVSGPDTQLIGVLVGGLGGIGLRDLTGRAGSGLLGLAPGFGLDCDSRATVDMARATWSRSGVRAEGSAQIAEGLCRAGGRDVPLPASEVILTEEGTAGLATARSLSGVPLGSLRITPERRATLTVDPEGAALVMGSPTSAALVVDLPF